ncbi:unnamed protein product [Schistosoma intercalatum]|nr:unnamed protein product [Schistosoma intercalatum]
MESIDHNPGELKRVIIHELGHTFGFDYRLFPYLRHDDGSPRTMRNQHTGEPELPTNANEGLKADRSNDCLFKLHFKRCSINLLIGTLFSEIL